MKCISLQCIFSTKVIKQLSRSICTKAYLQQVADVFLMSAGHGCWPPIKSSLFNIIRYRPTVSEALNTNRVLCSKSTCPGISTGCTTTFLCTALYNNRLTSKHKMFKCQSYYGDYSVDCFLPALFKSLIIRIHTVYCTITAFLFNTNLTSLEYV